MKQTAIEFLISKIESNSNPSLTQQELKESIEQANKMFEQQIIDSYWGGLNGSINDYSESNQVGSEIIGIKHGKGAEQYYNETFKK